MSKEEKKALKKQEMATYDIDFKNEGIWSKIAFIAQLGISTIFSIGYVICIIVGFYKGFTIEGTDLIIVMVCMSMVELAMIIGDVIVKVYRSKRTIIKEVQNEQVQN